MLNLFLIKFTNQVIKYNKLLTLNNDMALSGIKIENEELKSEVTEECTE